MSDLNRHLTNEILVKKPTTSMVRLAMTPAFLTLFSICVSLSPAVAKADKSKGFSQNSKHARNHTLAEIRKVNSPYVDVRNALEAGYVSTVDLGAGCIDAQSEMQPAQLGGMGIHFVKLAEVGLPDFDFLTPSVLVYAPNPKIEHCTYTTDELLEGGNDCAESLQLVAVEELIFAHLWQATIDEPHWKAPPEFLGNQFYYIHDNLETDWVDEAHGFPPHYELHIWLYDHNPSGLYAPWNPTVSCPAAMQDHEHME